MENTAARRASGTPPTPPFELKLSVITAALDCADGLDATFRSLLGQSWNDWEWIVVDGGSRDGSAGLLQRLEREHPGRVKWISEPDGGIYHAMNKGIAMSAGDALGFLGCGDTFADSSSLRHIAEAMEEGVGAVYGDLIYVSQADPERIVRSWHGSPYSSGIFDSGWQPAHPTFYARRECFRRYGCFDVSLAISADFDIMFRMLEVYGISNRYLPMVLVRMLNGGASNGSLRNVLTAHRNIHRSFRKYGRRAPLLYSVRRILPKLINNLIHVLRVQGSVNKG